jgi:4-amino-4-deoxy-L-arabinose transferase-like glycosyltransferase
LPPESTFSPKVAKPLPAARPPSSTGASPYLAMTDSKTTEEAAATSQPPLPEGAIPPPAPAEGQENGAAVPGDAARDAAPAAPAKKKKKKKKDPQQETAEASTSPETEKEAEGDVLLAKGNPLRLIRGGLTAGIASFLAYLIMAHNGQLRIGVPLGIFLLAIATFGVMDLLGSFDDAAENVATETTLGELTVPIARTLATLVLYAVTIAGGLSGALSQWLWGVLVTIAFLGLVSSVFELGVKLGPWRVDELGLARPIWQREGFWVIAVGAVLMLPCLGAYSLWDPWETHYGEVAREILARDDWISLWWAQDGWFWSKPILDFWIQAIFMATLGVHYKPDQMLQGVGGATAHPEWVVRTPVFLLTILAMYLIYKGVAKFFGRRAGLLGGLVLATMPDWYFLGHQTMTDMPCIAPMTSAMGLLICGLFVDPEKRVKVYEVKTGSIAWRLSGWHLVFGAIILVALPQILYLFSRNLELVVHGSGGHGFRAHWDEFRSGSGGGNCGLPGNEACASTASSSIPPSLRNGFEGFLPSLWRLVGAFEPIIQAALWSAVLGTVLYLNWGERRTRRLYYLGAWFFAAIATMGKGPEGFALPMLCTFVYLCVSRRWVELLRLEILSGLLIILCVALPWYVASYVRHGSPFTDRLIFHDMFNRAFHHVHDTNEGDDTSFRFYVWQLGYALFPWTGLSALGLIYWLRRPDSSEKGKNDIPVLLTMWFLFGFALFSFMGTKFHHYLFPCVPPIAMLLGIVLDDFLGPGPLLSAGRAPAEIPPGSQASKGLLPVLAIVCSGVALLVAGVTRLLPGSILGTKNGNDLALPGYPLGATLIVVGLLAVVSGLRRFRAVPADAPRPKSEARADGAESAPFRDEDPVKRAARAEAKVVKRGRVRHEHLMLAAAAASAALVLGIVARDLIIKPDNADQPGAIRLLQLFTYNYRRSWPDSLDFSAILTGFSVVAVGLGLALSVRAWRRPVTIALLSLGFVWAIWGLDVYMMKMSPHWGQHEVIQAYYDNRKGPEEPLVAYQMNWKGENFYAGNKIPAFVSSGGTFTTWLKQQREKGVTVMYFITEHGRIGGLKGEVGGKNYKEITDKVLNNKFVVVRAEL